MNKFEFTRKNTYKRQNFTALNVEKLKGVLSYFSYLHANGEINDKAFETLVNYACSIFIENEVEYIVQETLEQKLIKLLHSKFTTSAKEIESEFYSLNISGIIRS